MAIITEADLRARLAEGLPNPLPIGERDRLTPAASDFLKARGIDVRRAAGRTRRDVDARVDPTDGYRSIAIRTIPVGVSNRHVHLSPEHVEALFGPGYRLTPLRELKQQGQFAARETVSLIGPRGILTNVRVLGPSRGVTQVEISRTDGYALGIHPPIRLSGDHADTPGIAVAGERGAVVLGSGVIVARNHVHMSDEEARSFGVSNGDRLSVRSLGDRPVVFADVAVRVSPAFRLEMHIDLDEANAANLKTGDVVRLLGNSAGED